jgi:hypothetical protein
VRTSGQHASRGWAGAKENAHPLGRVETAEFTAREMRILGRQQVQLGGAILWLAGVTGLRFYSMIPEREAHKRW